MGRDAASVSEYSMSKLVGREDGVSGKGGGCGECVRVLVHIETE
jgi:hypothetical protein